jgi:hypothetical protein
MTSYNPNDVKMGYCGNCHDHTSVPAPDPQFVDRPQHVDFYRLAAQIKMMDREADVASAEIGDRVLIMDDVDQYSVAYMAQQRVMRARALLAEEDGNTTGREGVLWVDGFIAGKRYAESLAQGEVISGVPQDGNRRVRRTRK